MTSSDDLLNPGALFQGRFRIERALGRGGMGEVYAALDTTLERPVAIKVIHSALAGDACYAERFLRETRLVARVAHPNIVRVYDAGMAPDGRLFMIMERVFGVSLRERMAGGARLERLHALHYAIQIADALKAAHEAALVHRDVKPENILVSEGVHARLFDFGVAKDGRGSALTRYGAAIGRSRYMAPEQILGSSDARADIYALGVVLYEMLTGAHPYAVLDEAPGIGETEIQAAHVYLAARPLSEALPGCPEALVRAVATCLAKRPDERFQRAEELSEALRAVAQASMPGGEEPIARQIVRDRADAARAQAVRGSVLRGSPAANALQETAPLPPGFLPISPVSPRVASRKRLGVAQMFEVAPGLLVAAARRVGARSAVEPAPLAADGGALEKGQPGQGGGESRLPSTGTWDAAAPAVTEQRLPKTEPWEGGAAFAGAATVTGSAKGRAAGVLSRWWLWLFVAVIGLLAALSALWLLRVREGGG